MLVAAELKVKLSTEFCGNYGEEVMEWNSLSLSRARIRIRVEFACARATLIYHFQFNLKLAREGDFYSVKELSVLPVRNT